MVYMASVFVGQSIRGALMGSRRLMMMMMTLPLALGKLPSIEGGYQYNHPLSTSVKVLLPTKSPVAVVFQLH